MPTLIGCIICNGFKSLLSRPASYPYKHSHHIYHLRKTSQREPVWAVSARLQRPMLASCICHKGWAQFIPALPASVISSKLISQIEAIVSGEFSAADSEQSLLLWAERSCDTRTHSNRCCRCCSGKHVRLPGEEERGVCFRPGVYVYVCVCVGVCGG